MPNKLRMKQTVFKVTLLIALFLGWANESFSSLVFNDNCETAYRNIINLKLADAEKNIQAEKAQRPGNVIVNYLESSSEFFKVFIQEEQPLYDHFRNNTSERLKRIEGEEKNTPYYLFCQAEIYLQSAFLRVKFKEYITAAYEIRKAFKLLERNVVLFPAFTPNKKSLGLVHAMISAIPDDYMWIVNSVGLKGTIKEAVHELDEVVSSDKYPVYRTEALIFKSFIDLNIKKNKKHVPEVLEMLKSNDKDNDNLFLTYAIASIAMHSGKNEDAISALTNKPVLPGYTQFYYLDYLMGRVKLNRLDSDADVFLLKFIQNFKGKNYVKSAYQKLAWHSLINGEPEKYKHYMQLVLKNGASDMDEDEQALKEAQSGRIPNVALLKTRLLFDGGYYQKAMAQIAMFKVTALTSYKDQVELTYRLARIYHETGNIDKAMEYYAVTLKNGGNSGFYFVASSALHLALIYEGKADLINARKFFNTCLALKSEEYKHSLNQKAKAGINRISA